MDGHPTSAKPVLDAELTSLWTDNPSVVANLKNNSETSKGEKLLARFSKRRCKTFKEKGAAYRAEVLKDAIDEEKEANHVSDCLHPFNENGTEDLLQSSTSKVRRKKKKLLKKSASFDYADLRNEEDFPSRMSVRRTAICAKSKSTDAIQLETFIIVSRLKQFDLL